MSDKKFEIAIIGGGIAGMTFGLALHARGIPFTIYEQAHHFGEIGAGVAFGPNAVRAMKKCHNGIHEAFEKVNTRNAWPSKSKVWFDYLDGCDKTMTTAGHQDAIFTISNSVGQNGVYRAHFLDKLTKLLPGGVSHFGKRLESVDEPSDGSRLVLHFADGTQAEADAIVGCDGIKSRVRSVMFGEDHPCAHPTYTHKYAYRGLIPMDKAIEAVGEERARNACMYMGPNNHLLSFPVRGGEILNIVAFHMDPGDWPDYSKLTRPAKREDALRDFEGYGPNVMALLNLTEPVLDCWAIFHLGDHPVPSFAKGRISIIGDAAHATSPHHGAGAGVCIEDSAVLAELLADPRVKTAVDLEAAFLTFDLNRRERGQWLVQSSAFVGDVYEWRAKGVEDDFSKMETDINACQKKVVDFQIEEGIKDALTELHRQLDVLPRQSAVY